MKLANVFWWHYKPSDEREQELYRKAYSRAFKSLMTFVVVGIVILSGLDRVDADVVVLCIALSLLSKTQSLDAFFQKIVG